MSVNEVNENRDNLLKLQNRVSKIVDELAIVNSNLETFKTAVTQDVQNIVRVIQQRHSEQPTEDT